MAGRHWCAPTGFRRRRSGTYSLAQRLAKQKRYAHLRPHVADMLRALGKGRRLPPDVVGKNAAERAARTAAEPPDPPAMNL